MNRKTMTKMMAAFLAFILSFANVAMLGIYTTTTYASTAKLEEQDTNVNKAEIEFDAYFKENEKITHSKTMDVANESEMLYLDLKVKEGYLANANIKISDANFKIQDKKEELSIIQDTLSDENKIVLNQIGKGESAILEIPITINADSSFDVKDIAKTAKIELEGKYVSKTGKEIVVNKTIEIETVLDGTAESILSEEVSKYVTYEIGGSKGVILQTIIKSKLVDNKLPVKSTRIEIETPAINNIKPKTITLLAKSQMATNGKAMTKVFSEEEYSIEDSKIVLVLDNENNKLSWIKNAEDEIILTCIYDENAIAENAEIELNAKSEITYYGKTEKTVEAIVNNKKELTEQVGDIVTPNIELSKDKLYKGYMLNNKNTSFTNKLSLNIAYSELMDKIVFQDETKYIDEYGNTFPSNALYKSVKISEENLKEILGEDGYINILNNNGEAIDTLNKGKLEIVFENEISNISFETSKPKTEGILEIESAKEIKALEYQKTQIEEFVGYRTDLATNIYKDNVAIIRGISSKEMILENPKTETNLVISKKDLSTLVKNEDVELRVTLKTVESSSALYKNPKMEIVLPSYIENIEIENVQLLYENELKFAETKMFRNQNGNIVISIILKGEQTKYNEDAISEGATLIMNADITVDKLTPTREEKVYLNIVNENVKDAVSFETNIKFVAPTGMVTVNQISGYNDKQEQVSSINGKKEIGEIEVKAAAKTASVNMLVINNYDYECGNIKILGRTPFEGNKSIKTGADIGSTFTAKVTSGIRATLGVQDENITVYYSSNGNATKDVNDILNGWTQDIGTLNEVKSYMIVLNNVTLKTGDTVGFTYNVEIPANLEHNEETHGIFTVYYTRQNSEVAINNEAKAIKIAAETITGISAGVRKMLAQNDEVIAYEEGTESGVAGVSTGAGPNLEVTMTAVGAKSGEIGNGRDVIEKDIVKYKVAVKNKSEIASAEKIKVKVTIPGNAYYIKDNLSYSDIKELTINIAEILPRKTSEAEFTLKMPSYGGAEVANSINVKAEATVEGYPDIFKAEHISNIVKNEDPIDITIDDGLSGNYDVGIEVRYAIKPINNTGTTKLDNVVVTCNVPDGIEFVEVVENGQYEGQGITYSYANGVITWNIKEFNDPTLIWVGKTKDFTEGYEKKVSVEAEAQYNGKRHSSGEFVKYIVKEGFTVTQEIDKSSEYISAGEEVIYKILITNQAPKTLVAEIKDKLPNELKFKKYYYTQDGKETLITKIGKTQINLRPRIKSGETFILNIVGEANTVTNDTKIVNNVTVTGKSISKESASRELTILGTKGPAPTNDPNKPNEPDGENKTYVVSGKVWLDANKDGKRSDEEKLLSGIKTYLLDGSTNKIIKETTTNETGSYTFTDVKNGRYIIAFEYDTTKYDITLCQVNGVDASFNSDAINMNITLNGSEKKVAATNSMMIDSNTYNVDLGLVDSPKFDMKLEKTVSLIQVSTENKVDNYRFDNVESAKVELDAKRINGALVAITYTFKVTNEGAVSGYVNRIADYKAKDLNFSSTLNPEWYQDADGNLYTGSLKGREIKPGETVELSLILTKTMTTENVGLSNNTAELVEVSNDLGLPDIDSTPANKNVSEDDFGKADVIITIKTGGILFYGGIVLAVLGIFALGAYEINKRVLSRV